MNDTTQMGVSTDEQDSVDTEVTEKRELTDRERMMNEIARQNAELEGREYPAETAEETTELSADTQATDDGLSADAPAKAAADPLDELGYYRKPDGQIYTKLKINGEEREVLASQVKAYSQKVIAGEQALRQAAEERTRLQAERADLDRERQERLRQSLSQPSPMDADDIKDKAKAFIQKIYDGEEGAENDLVAFMQSARTTVNPNDIIQAAKAEMKSELERERQADFDRSWSQSVEDGNEALYNNHPEIYQDQTLFGMVNNRTAEMVQAKQQGDPEYINLAPADIIAKAATEVQDWLDSRTNKAKPSGNSRQQRKDGLKPMPNGLGTVNQKPKAPVLDTSPLAAIARMKNSRAVI